MTDAHSPTADTLQLPADLIPSDGRFGCGPSKVRPAQIDAIVAGATTIMGTSHRQPAVKNIVRDIREGLAEFFSLPEGYEVILSLGGATAFWDAATYGLIENRSAHLSFGEFSAKFAKASQGAPWLAEPTIVQAPAGQAPNPSDLAGVDADVVAWAHNETSTGAMVDIIRPNPDTEQLVVVDATSGAGGLPVDFSQVDVYYFSPQKCFASDGGLWLAVVSPAALERIERIAASDRYIPEFFNLQAVVDNSRKNQTYNTPAVASLVMLAEQISWMNELGGLDAMVQRCRTSADIIYSWAQQRPETTAFVEPDTARSSVVATVDFADTVDAAVIARVLRAHGIVDVEPYRKLGRNQLRIGMFPAIEPEDIATLTRAIDFILDSGVATVQS